MPPAQEKRARVSLATGPRWYGSRYGNDGCTNGESKSTVNKARPFRARRHEPGRRGRLFVVAGALAVLVGGCGSGPFHTGGRTDAQVAADGAAQVERHVDDPLMAAVEVPGLRPFGDLTISPRAANHDSGLFGDIGVSPTSYLWVYKLEPGADLETVLDAAVAVLEERGASLGRTTDGGRTLSAESFGDRLTIVFLALEFVIGEIQISHKITISGN